MRQGAQRQRQTGCTRKSIDNTHRLLRKTKWATAAAQLAVAVVTMQRSLSASISLQLFNWHPQAGARSAVNDTRWRDETRRMLVGSLQHIPSLICAWVDRTKKSSSNKQQTLIVWRISNERNSCLRMSRRRDAQVTALVLQLLQSTWSWRSFCAHSCAAHFVTICLVDCRCGLPTRLALLHTKQVKNSDSQEVVISLKPNTGQQQNNCFQFPQRNRSLNTRKTI